MPWFLTECFRATVNPQGNQSYLLQSSRSVGEMSHGSISWYRFPCYTFTLSLSARIQTYSIYRIAQIYIVIHVGSLSFVLMTHMTHDRTVVSTFHHSAKEKIASWESGHLVPSVMWANWRLALELTQAAFLAVCVRDLGGFALLYSLWSPQASPWAETAYWYNDTLCVHQSWGCGAQGKAWFLYLKN